MSEFLCFKSCFKKSKVKSSIPENARHGSSLGGNFVTEHGIESPISDTYDLTTILLGTGSSAKVVVGKHKATQRRYAIKIIDTTKKNISWRYEREKQLLKEVDHTHSPTHSLTHLLTHSLTHSPTHRLIILILLDY